MILCEICLHEKIVTMVAKVRNEFVTYKKSCQAKGEFKEEKAIHRVFNHNANL
jgi:hypothetical protein